MLLPKFKADFSAEEWERWKEMFAEYLRTKSSTKRAMAGDLKLSFLKIVGGVEMVDLLKSLPSIVEHESGFRVTEGDGYGEAIAKINAHFDDIKNPLQERCVFRGMRQDDGEKMKEFVLRLRNQARRCEFDDPEKEVKEQVITGTKDVAIKKKALRNKNVTLQEIVTESAINESLAVASNFFTFSTVNVVNARPNVPSKAKKVCYCCQEVGHFAIECPSRRSQICYNCGKAGHVALRCYSLGYPQTGPGEDPSSSTTTQLEHL